MAPPLLIRNVSIGNETGLDVAIAHQKILAIGRHLTPQGLVLEGHGAALLPGLHDHHIHLFALAAQLNSVRLDAPDAKAAVADQLQIAAKSVAPGAWLRATGYDDSLAGAINRDILDRWVPDHPLRIQYRTGTLWVFNSLALEQLASASIDAGSPEATVSPLEREERGGLTGRFTGRLWHGDAWLKARLKGQTPCFAAVGRLLAEVGVTGVTDASVNTGQEEAALLAQARRRGELPQRLHLMSGGALSAHSSGLYSVGPVKIMLHEARLPAFSELVSTVVLARSWQRQVAFHCATSAELAVALAVLTEAGFMPGDRIEHGSVIEPEAAEVLAERGLIVVTQPAFIHARGDRYLREVDEHDHANLYRCGTLLKHGIPVAGSSDAPYATADPWVAIKAASTRRTRQGRLIGADEAITPLQALNLFLTPPENPGGVSRRVELGADADLCLLNRPLEAALRSPHQACVAATIIAGEPVFVRAGAEQEI